MFNPSNMYMPLRSLAPLARKGINWAGLLTNTQKTLNIVNQAIPLVYQAKPIISNARTMFKIANEFTKSNSKGSSVNKSNNINVSNSNIENKSYDDSDNQPYFFI